MAVPAKSPAFDMYRIIPGWILLVLLASCLLAMGVALVLSRAQQPIYNGKHLSEWVLACSENPEEPSSASAAFAVRSIGTNGLPWLMKWIDAEPPPWKYKLHELVCKLPTRILQSFFGKHVIGLCNPDADRVSAHAAVFSGFRALGTRATPAIPALCRIARTSRLHDRAALAMCALCQMGENAIPPLCDLVSDPSNPNRGTAAFYVGCMGRDHHLGKNAHQATLVLAACLEDTNWDYALTYSVATALGEIAIEPNLTVPALARTLANPRADIKVAATTSLRKFGAQARPAVPAFVRNLADKDPFVAMAASYALGDIALEPEAAVPALANTLCSHSYFVREAAAYALGQFHFGARPAVPALVTALDDSDPTVRSTAKHTIWEIDREFYESAQLRTRDVGP